MTRHSRWTSNPPRGVVDQAELDEILANWGHAGILPRPIAVPEPHAVVLLLIGWIAVLSGSMTPCPRRSLSQGAETC